MKQGPPKMLTGREEDGRGSVAVSVLLFVLIVVLAALLLFEGTVLPHCFLVNVEGDSMLHTLYGGEKEGKHYVGGDVLYADRDLKPERGDIVIIDVTHNPSFDAEEDEGSGSYLIVKRLIATEGDRIVCENGTVYLGKNGEEPKELSEPYVYGYNNVEFDYTLKAGEIFCMGDNRTISKDSRYAGPFREEDVIGVVPDWSVTFKGVITGWENFRLWLADFFSSLALW